MVYHVIAHAALLLGLSLGNYHILAKLHPSDGDTPTFFSIYKTWTPLQCKQLCPALVAVAAGPLLGGVLLRVVSYSSEVVKVNRIKKQNSTATSLLC